MELLRSADLDMSAKWKQRRKTSAAQDLQHPHDAIVLLTRQLAPYKLTEVLLDAFKRLKNPNSW